jgi:hypothetical protein
LHNATAGQAIAQSSIIKKYSITQCVEAGRRRKDAWHDLCCICEERMATSSHSAAGRSASPNGGQGAGNVAGLAVNLGS